MKAEGSEKKEKKVMDAACPILSTSIPLVAEGPAGISLLLLVLLQRET